MRGDSTSPDKPHMRCTDRHPVTRMCIQGCEAGSPRSSASVQVRRAPIQRWRHLRIRSEGAFAVHRAPWRRGMSWRNLDVRDGAGPAEEVADALSFGASVVDAVDARYTGLLRVGNSKAGLVVSFALACSGNIPTPCARGRARGVSFCGRAIHRRRRTRGTERVRSQHRRLRARSARRVQS